MKSIEHSETLFKSRITFYYLFIYMVKLSLILTVMGIIIWAFFGYKEKGFDTNTNTTTQIILIPTFIASIFFLKSFLHRSLKTISVFEEYIIVCYFFVISKTIMYSNIGRIYFTRDTIEGEGGGFGESECNIELKDLSMIIISESEIYNFELFTSEFIAVVKSNRQKLGVDIN